jgi:hypothetical protein
MPDVDPLAFGIRFALTHEPIGREAKKIIVRARTRPPVQAGGPALTAESVAAVAPGPACRQERSISWQRRQGR